MSTASLFQSHNGAIAAKSIPTKRCPTTTFQSHNGAIAACNDIQLAVGSDDAFNPTMVRLLPKRE